MEITDKFINDLFEGTNFGKPINESTEKKRGLLHKNIQHQTEGYWTGHTLYHIMVYGGFIVDGKKGTKKALTHFGYLFMDTK